VNNVQLTSDRLTVGNLTIEQSSQSTTN